MNTYEHVICTGLKAFLDLLRVNKDNKFTDLQWVNKQVLTAARAHGCVGLQNTKNGFFIDELCYYLTEHREELEDTNSDKSIEDLQKENLVLKNSLLSIKSTKELNKYVEIAAVESKIKAICSAQRALLKTLLIDDLPQKIAGASVPDIIVQMEDVLEQICILMQTLKFE